MINVFMAVMQIAWEKWQDGTFQDVLDAFKTIIPPEKFAELDAAYAERIARAKAAAAGL